MAPRSCFYCEAEATHECPTCGRLYCPDHGEEACLRCIAPEASVPNAWAFRGSLLALLAGLGVTAYLVISPPESQGDTMAVPVATPTATATPVPTPVPTRPGAAPVARPTSTPTTLPTATPTPTPATRAYTVTAGDTLSGIAEEFGVTVAAIVSLNPDLDPDFLTPGQVIQIPAGE